MAIIRGNYVRNRQLRLRRMKRGSYNVRIRRNDTREVRNYTLEVPWEEHSEYMWREGSFSCDCNLEIFFNRAVGVEFPDIDLKCGNTRFTALSVELPTGVVIMLEKSNDLP